jgi:hypothetical protein
MQSDASENDGIRCRGELADASRVGYGLDLMKQFEIGEVVYVDLVLENDDDAIPSEAHSANLGSEGELPDAPVLLVVPNHDFVGRIQGLLAAADQCQDVAAEEHLHHGDAAVREVSLERPLEGLAVEDPEAGLGGTGEAAMVLVEGSGEEVVGGVEVGRGGGGRRRRRGRRGRGRRIVGDVEAWRRWRWRIEIRHGS